MHLITTASTWAGNSAGLQKAAIMNSAEHSLPEYKNYEVSLVAFIDILGFCERVNAIQNSADFFKVGKLLYTMKETANSFNSAGELLENFRFTAVSDSIIITIPFHDPVCVTGLVAILHSIQYDLLATSFKAIIRGYIGKGPVYHADGLIFGSGYNDAYNGEQHIGGAPRIVISPKIIEEATQVMEQYSGTKMVSFFDYVREDQSDGFYFIDYLKPVGGSKMLPIEQLLDERSSIETFIEESLNKFKKDYRVLPKYKWLKNYFKESEAYTKNV